MRSLLVLFIGAIFLFTGCSSKRYYEPQNINGEVAFDKSIPASIADVRRDGATLENGFFITKDTLVESVLPEGFNFVNSSENYYFAASSCGEFLILNREGLIVKKKQFEASVVGVSESDDILALLLANNQTVVIDLKSDELLFSEKQSASYAHTNIVANPYFLNDLVLLPTLDGKIVIYDKRAKKSIRDIVVDDERYFNNVLFLDVLENRLVAATPKKIISVSPDIINSYDADIRDVVFVRDRIYIFTKDGRVVLADIDLNVKKEMKFPFAHFLGAMHGKYIYALEKEGYFLGVDIDLLASNIFALPSEIDENVFITTDRVYFGDRYFELGNK